MQRWSAPWRSSRRQVAGTSSSGKAMKRPAAVLSAMVQHTAVRGAMARHATMLSAMVEHEVVRGAQHDYSHAAVLNGRAQHAAGGNALSVASAQRRNQLPYNLRACNIIGKA